MQVAGGEAVGRAGKKIYFDDTEVFTGKRWVKSGVKLDQPRAGFSLVKISQKKVKKTKGRTPRKQKKSSRKSNRRSNS